MGWTSIIHYQRDRRPSTSVCSQQSTCSRSFYCTLIFSLTLLLLDLRLTRSFLTKSPIMCRNPSSHGRHDESLALGIFEEEVAAKTTRVHSWKTEETQISPSAEWNMMVDDLKLASRLFLASVGMSILLISWEDLSMYHPMRIESSMLVSSPSPSPFGLKYSWGRSTIRGMAAGDRERMAIAGASDLEASAYEDLRSYNEVMLEHRRERIPRMFNTDDMEVSPVITRENVVDSVRAVQVALLRVLDCQVLAKDYEWDALIASLNEQSLRRDLEEACYVLKRAEDFLSKDARDEIGFDWGSCAWRHCGALSDAQEAIDALEHQVGMLEPFECVYCLDVVERSLRDILAVTSDFQDDKLNIPDYIQIQRMSDLTNADSSNGDLDRQDADYMNTLSLLRNTEFE